MDQAFDIVALKLKAVVYAQVNEELSTNGRKKVDCEQLVKESITELVSNEEKEKCKKGELSDNYFFDKADIKKVVFEATPSQSECFDKGEKDRTESFKSTHQLLKEKLKDPDIDLVKLCTLAKVKYVDMEKNRREVISKCSSAEKPKCQIADSNGNCPGSEEAVAFEIKKNVPVMVVPGSNNLQSRLQRISADKTKCEVGRDPYACARMKSRGARGIGK
jgi:hypothetical protein